MGAVGLREDEIKGEVTLRWHSRMHFSVQLGFKVKLRIADKGYKVELESLEGKRDAEKRMRITIKLMNAFSADV
jgi:hypothetical protein